MSKSETNSRKVNPKVVALAVMFQAVVGFVTVRDISHRTSDEVRGPRLLWKLWGGTNTLGSAAYWLAGRRRTGD